MSETDESQPGAGGGAAELEALQARMAEIKAEVTEELIRDWPSVWRNDEMTNAKVTGRLSSHKEYQTLLARQRVLQKELGVQAAPREVDEAQDPMGAYSIKLAKAARETREP
jgi:hypothetical protein